MPFTHSAEFKSQCKALVQTGRFNIPDVVTFMEELTGTKTTEQSVGRWLKDPSIPPDMVFVRALANQVDAKVVGYVDNLASRLQRRIEAEIGKFDEDTGEWVEGTGAKGFDLHQDIKSLTFLTNLVRPANGSGAGGGGHFQVNVQGPQIVLPFEARPIEAPAEATEQIPAPVGVTDGDASDGPLEGQVLEGDVVDGAPIAARDVRERSEYDIPDALAGIVDYVD